MRPDLFRLAVSSGWTLYELHQEAGSLEDLFRELTGPESGTGESAADGAAGGAGS